MGKARTVSMREALNAAGAMKAEQSPPIKQVFQPFHFRPALQI